MFRVVTLSLTLMCMIRNVSGYVIKNNSHLGYEPVVVKPSRILRSHAYSGYDFQFDLSQIQTSFPSAFEMSLNSKVILVPISISQPKPIQLIPLYNFSIVDIPSNEFKPLDESIIPTQNVAIGTTTTTTTIRTTLPFSELESLSRVDSNIVEICPNNECTLEKRSLMKPLTLIERVTMRIINFERALGSKLMGQNIVRYLTEYEDGNKVLLKCNYTPHPVEDFKILCQVVKLIEKLESQMQNAVSEEITADNFKPSTFTMKRRKRDLKPSIKSFSKVDKVNKFMPIYYDLDFVLSPLTSSLKSCLVFKSQFNYLEGIFEINICETESTFISENGTCSPNINCKQKAVDVKDEACSDHSIKLPSKLSVSKFSEYQDLTDLYQFCSIKIGDKLKNFRHCDQTVTKNLQLTIISINQELIIPKNSRIQEFFDPTVIDSYNCSTNLLCKEGKCRGDETYLDHFGGGTESTYCSFNKDNKRIIYSDSGRHYDISCYQKGLFEVQEEILTTPIIPVLIEVPNYLCNEGHLNIDGETENVEFIKVCITGLQCIFITDTNKTDLLLPGVMTYKKRVILVYTKLKLTNIQRLNRVQCSESDPCLVVNCWLCKEKWTTLHCFTSLEWIILIVFFLVVVTLVKLILTFLQVIVHLFIGPFQMTYKLVFCCIGLCRKKPASDKTTEQKQKLILNNKRSIEKKDTNQSRRFGKHDFMLSLLIITLTLSTALSSDCSSQTSLLATTKNCKFSSDKDLCILNSNAVIKLTTAGESSCLQVSDIGGKSSQLFSIKLIDYKLECLKETLYYTGAIEPICHASHRCYSAGSCNGDICEKVSSNSTIPELPTTTGGWFQYSCEKVCGCAGCGCFYCSESCLFSLMELKLISEIYEVSRCSSWVPRFWMNVTTISKGQVTTETVVLSINSITRSPKFDMSIVSYNNPIITNSEDCFLKNKNSYSMTSCNKKTQVLKGIIGEVQCPSEVSLKQVSRNCFINEDLFMKKTSSDGISCMSSQVDPSKVFKQNPLPIYKTGLGEYGFNDEGVNININQNSLIELQLTFKNFEVHMVKPETKCHGTMISLSGCYSCSEGAEMRLSLVTDQDSSLTTIICPNAKEVTTTSRSVKEKQILKFYFSKSVIDYDCIISCSAGNTTMKVKGTLKFIPQVANILSQHMDIAMDGTSSSFDIRSILTSNWLRVTLGFLGLCFLLIVLIIILKLIRLSRHKQK